MKTDSHAAFCVDRFVNHRRRNVRRRVRQLAPIPRPRAAGVSAKPLPMKWDAKTNIVWSLKSPAAAGPARCLGRQDLQTAV